MKIKTLIVVTLLTATLSACSNSKPKAPKKTILIENAWIRAVPPVSKNSAGYMTITNTANSADQLLSITADIAENVEVHEFKTIDQMMMMSPMDKVILPANSSIELKPHGKHLMLNSLKTTTQIGKLVKVTFNFKNAGKISVDIPIKMSGMSAVKHMNHGAMKSMDHDSMKSMKNMHNMKKMPSMPAN